MSDTGFPPDQNGTRRSFYVRLIYGMWALIGSALSIAAALYLLVPPKARKRDEWIEIGDVADFAGLPVEIAFRRIRADGWKVVSEKVEAWVVRTADNQVVALAAQCTHLGCFYHWDERQNQFVCPCHNSLFSIDGQVLAGPAPRPLDRYRVRIEGKKVLLGI